VLRIENIFRELTGNLLVIERKCLHALAPVLLVSFGLLLNAQSVPNLPGTISTVATPGFSLLLTAGVTVDQQNNIYISDTNRSRILKVNQQTGVTSVYAGTGMSLVIGQPNGDGGPATSGVLNYPEGLAVAANGDLYIAEAGDVRKVAGNIEARRAGSSRRLHCQRLFYVGQPD